MTQGIAKDVEALRRKSPPGIAFLSKTCAVCVWFWGLLRAC